MNLPLLDLLFTKSIKRKLGPLESSSDGKWATMSTDDYEFYIEVDTDDCDAILATDSATFIRELFNQWPEIRRHIN